MRQRPDLEERGGRRSREHWAAVAEPGRTHEQGKYLLGKRKGRPAPKEDDESLMHFILPNEWYKYRP